MLILDGLLFLLILLRDFQILSADNWPSHELVQYCMLFAVLRCFHVTEKVEQYLLCDGVVDWEKYLEAR